MKNIKRYSKRLALVLATSIFIQGCTVYKSASVSLDEAVRADTKVKVKTSVNKTLKFNRVKFEEGQYYGLKEIYKDDAFETSKKETIRTELDINEIESIQIKNQTMSTILPFAVPLVILGILIIGYTMPTW
jgi:hypothetical protein